MRLISIFGANFEMILKRSAARICNRDALVMSGGSIARKWRRKHMNIASWIQKGLLVVAIGASASLPAHATVDDVMPPVTQPVTSVDVSTYVYSFASIVGQLYTVSLTDIGSPAPFDVLLGNITEGPSLIGKLIVPKSGTDSVSFQALTSQTNISIFALAGLLPGATRAAYASEFYLSAQTSSTPVPEPAVWLMMLGGIGLLGWMRVRKSENLS